MTISPYIASEQTNTLGQFIETKHISPTFTYIVPNKKILHKCHFAYLCLLFLFRPEAPPMTADCWSAQRCQTPNCPRQLQTCAPLMHGRGPGAPPPLNNSLATPVSQIRVKPKNTTAYYHAIFTLSFILLYLFYFLFWPRMPSLPVEASQNWKKKKA